MRYLLKRWRLNHKARPSSEIVPILGMMLGAIIISFSGVYVKLVDVAPSVSAFYRMFFGGIMLLIMVVFRKKQYWHSWKYFIFSAIAGLAIAYNLIIWHKAILYVGPGLATMLGNFQVFIMAFFGFFLFKEKLTFRFLFAILLAITGLFLMVGMDWDQASESYQFGIYFGLGTAVCYATYLLFLRIVQVMDQPLSAITNLCIITIIATITLYLIAISNQESLAIPNLHSWIYLMCYGLFSQVIGWGIITFSLPRVKASLAGFILLMQPALTFVWDVLFFERLLNWSISLGIFITLTAIYLGTSSRGPDNKKP
jgi:drug/metabolite transporter (DMT)-like permease